MLEAVNYYHKAFHLGCRSSPRSASGDISDNKVDYLPNAAKIFCKDSLGYILKKYGNGMRIKLSS